MPTNPDHYLATYGTLAPGRANEKQLVGLNGTWLSGFVRGYLVEEGWGASMGFPGLVLDPEGDKIDIFIFESEDLAHHWDRLDAFEGEGYRRVVTAVWCGDQPINVNIYEVRR